MYSSKYFNSDYIKFVGGSGIGRHVGALPSAPMSPSYRKKDVEYGPDGEGDAAPNGPYPGDIYPSLQEHVCPGPQAKLRQ